MSRKLILMILGGCFSGVPLWAQPYIYFGGSNLGQGTAMGYLDLATCEYCIEFVIPQSVFFNVKDIQALPNGQVVVAGKEFVSGLDVISVFQPPSSTPISTFTTSGGLFGGNMTITPSGTIYYFMLNFTGNSTESCLNEFDPATNTNVVVGCADDIILTDLFFDNGILYSFGYTGLPPNQNFGLFSVTVGSPLQTSLINSLNTLCGGNTAVIPGVGVYSFSIDPNCNGWDIYTYDISNNSINLECSTYPQGYYGFSELPTGFPPPPATCACNTEVGEISSMDTILCTNEVLNINNTGSDLDSDDVIEYLLFSDLTDTLGSIIQTSTTPSFSFSNPPLTEGVTYYAVAIAGNELPGGGVDLTDICLDFSNVISVIWNPLPTVDFAVANSDVCEGECTQVEVILTGTPPFSLTYDTPGNAGQIETFGSTTGSLTICIPNGSPPGSFSLQAVSLTDANCLCE